MSLICQVRQIQLLRLKAPRLWLGTFDEKKKVKLKQNKMIFVDARNCFLKRKFVRFVCFRTLSGRGQTHFKPAPPKKNKGAKKIR